MELTVQRAEAIGKAIPGKLLMNGSFYCYTLERVGVQIPAGRYQMGLYPSPHFHRIMPIIEGVQDREDILIHWGDFPKNSEGCILVGERQDAMGDIWDTQKQWDALFPLIETAVKNEGCWITVKDTLPITTA